MHHRTLHRMRLVTCAVFLTTATYAQPSHWATPSDKTAKFMIDMERKWAEGVCVNNEDVTDLLADDFHARTLAASATTKEDKNEDEVDVYARERSHPSPGFPKENPCRMTASRFTCAGSAVSLCSHNRVGECAFVAAALGPVNAR
jgi:hypothetical protein